ncbi:MAG: UDP-N-acetylglucosamine 1-carboxyvinyltransferase, partial [Patescibacteria group bacterium]|nr:UDP-N-acetylglucosamine 1-carboxyvinyltransferase [Patescibacteria group bacterium]
ILFEDSIELQNISETADVEKMKDLLLGLGAKIEKGSMMIDASNLTSTDLDTEISRSMRSSVVTTGPILARYGKVSFPSPGGCVIGTRPVDLFFESYKKMGATVVENDGMFRLTAPKGGLRGADIFYPIQSVGATETIMMAAVLAKGTTTLRNCAMEPEIVSVAEWLNDCGADIVGAGTTTITIRGGKPLKAKKPYIAIPDRIETGSFLLLGALCADELLISNCEPRHVEAVTNQLVGAGVPLEIKKDSILIKGNGRIKNTSFHGCSIRTHEYPGFPTDLQPIMTVFLSQTTGESIVFETIFEGRFKYVDDLRKLGANVTVMNPREIFVQGPTLYKASPAGEELTAYDIRAGFAVVLAALCANGTSVINNVYFIDRGYEALEKTLSGLGADVQRIYGEKITD